MYKTSRAELTNKEYRCVYSPRTEGIGHKIFKRKTIMKKGAYEIADWSGDFPDETDDGRLRIDCQSPITVSYYDDEEKHGGYLSRSIKVIDDEDGGGVVGVNYDTYQFLKRNLKMDVLIKHGVV